MSLDEHAQSPKEGHEDNDINVGNYNDDSGDVYIPPTATPLLQVTTKKSILLSQMT